MVFRALGIPGALQERSARLFSAWGGPLGAAKARVMANYDGDLRRFLMVLLFVSSGLRCVPGGVQKSGLEPSRAQGPLPSV